MRTKSFPLLVVFLLPLLVVQNSCADSETLQGPDIIYIYTDQQSATMMSSAGKAGAVRSGPRPLSKTRVFPGRCFQVPAG